MGSIMAELEQALQLARTASGDELAALVYHADPAVLLALLENPLFDGRTLSLLLARKDLPADLLEEIGSRKPLLKTYAVKRALLFHPRAPRLVCLRLLRDVYLMDLVQFALTPAVSPELKRHAEEQVLARLPQRFAESAHQLAAARRRHQAPAYKGVVRGLDRGPRLTRRCLGHARGQAAIDRRAGDQIAVQRSRIDSELAEQTRRLAAPRGFSSDHGTCLR